MSDNKDSLADNYLDDNTILDETLLYRRILNQPNPPVSQIVWNENEKCWRPSTAAFKDHPQGDAMSVGLGDTLQVEGLTPDFLLIGHDDFSLVSFPAKLAREKNQTIVRRPLKDDPDFEDDPAHGEVFGNKTRGVRKAFAKQSVWYREPNTSSPD